MTEQGGEQQVRERAGRRRRRWTFALLAASMALHLLVIALLPRHSSSGESACPVLRLTVRKAEAAPEPQVVSVPEALPEPEPQQLAYSPAPKHRAAMAPATQDKPKLEAATEPRPASPLFPAENFQPAESPEPTAAAALPVGTSSTESKGPKVAPASEGSQAGPAEKPSQGPPLANPGSAPAGPEPKDNKADVPAVNVGALLKEYGQGVFASIKAQRYMPEEAERLGLEGTVRVWLKISSSGELLSVKVDSSSGHEAIDSAALEAARRAAPFKALPVEAGRDEAEFTFSLKYKLSSK